MSQKIGVIGLGHIGSSVVHNLAAAGYEVVAYDMAESAVESVAGTGAAIAESPAAVAENTQQVFLSLPNSAAVREVVSGDSGLLNKATRGMIISDLSTISPDTARDLNNLGATHGVRFLDSPITGGTKGAQAGKLNMLIGGEQEALSEIEPTLPAIAETWHYLGPSGAGQAAKLAHNLIGQGLVVLLSEAFVLGESQGLSAAVIFDVLRSYTDVCGFTLDKFAERVLADDLAPRFSLNMAHKDLTELIGFAHKENLPLIATSVVREVHNLGRCMGMGELDNTALLRMYRMLVSSAAPPMNVMPSVSADADPS